MLRRQNGEQHQMELADTHDSGAEEWHCPICGRRFLMQWPPNFKRIILESGDEEAVHTGGKGGVHSASAEPAQESDGLQPWQPSPEADTALERPDAEESSQEEGQDPGLSPELLAALDELDFSALDFDDEEE